MQRILALDIGAGSVKLGEFIALKEGGIELVKFGVAAMPAESASEADRAQQIAGCVREIMHDRGIKPGPVQLCVTGQSVFSRFVKLPPVEKEKVDQIILYEAQQNVPFPINEVVWDYQLIGRGEGELDVMLAAIKADIVETLTDAADQAGLEADLVDVSPMALYNAVRYNYADRADCTLVVDIGARSTDLIFLEQERGFIRSVPVGGNAITQQIMREFDLGHDDAEEMKRAHAFVAFGGAYEAPASETADKVSKIVRNVMTRMHAEIDRSIKFYRSQQNGQSPALVLLAGGSSVIPNTDNFLQEKLKVEVDYLNPFINVPVSKDISADEIGRHAHQIPQLVGLALRSVLACPIEINLLPPKVVAAKAFKRKEPFLVASAFGLVLLVALWCAYFAKMSSVASNDLGKVRSEVSSLQAVEAPLRAREGEISDMLGKIERLQGVVEKRTAWLEMLAEIQRNLPADLFLTAITPEREPKADVNQAGQAGAPAGSVVRVEISGMGYRDKVVSTAPIIDFRDKLRASPLFDEKTDFRLLPDAGQYVREFTIAVELREPLMP